MEKILEVKNLKISFRTQSGTLKAVRNISFDVKRGETLAIVGESGSGKSVTSKAILGILAGNSIIEGGEILYDGKDLLKISEEDMHKIRGDKISMIFQDPLSSLNPIVKIGKQITEAMLLKNKATRKMSRIEFNSLLAILKTNMIAARGVEEKDKIAQMIKDFDNFNIMAIKYETAYAYSKNKAEETIAAIEDVLFFIEKKQKINYKEKLANITHELCDVENEFFSRGYDEALKGFQLQAKSSEVKSALASGELAPVVELLTAIHDTLKTLCARTQPDFFSLGYYMCQNPKAEFECPIEEINKITSEFLKNEFMKEFVEYEVDAIKNSFSTSLAAKKTVIEALASTKEFFVAGEFTKKQAYAAAKSATDAVEASIDRLLPVKDSVAYTFGIAINAAIDAYFRQIVKNEKEAARFAKQTKKRDALINRGKKIDWKVVPASIIEKEELIADITRIIDRLIAKYENDIATANETDFETLATKLTEFFKEKASLVVYKLTKKIAKEKAIKLMDEVGIPESRMRYNQYPFEFSGGMRQRIVIAIALSANPDILICDEPTTALDVTIQSQILELINKLKKERNLSVIFITHDLGVVANMADKIGVMYAGKIVEYGSADDIFYDPRHPYTWALLSSMPDLDTNEKLEAIPGTPPNMIYPPVGDAFADRNKYALKIDYELQPPMFEISETHKAATWLLHPDAPKVETPKIIRDRIARMKNLGGAQDGE